jgi:hypothetical protein
MTETTQGSEAANIDLTEGLEQPDDIGLTVDVDPTKSATKAGDVTGVQFRPAVLVGLGGTGVGCVRRAKQKILNRVGKLPTVAYVCVDADEASFLNAPGMATVEQNERCFIGGDQLQPLLDQPEAHRWLLDQIPGKLAAGHYEKAVKGDGCGQVRTVGRVALLASMLNVKTAFTTALNRVERLVSGLSTKLKAAGQTATVVADPVVYIVCSLAGGTGSGAYLDAALLARTLTKHRAKMVGIFVLPDAFDEKVQGDESQLRIMRANAYAALMELQALQDMRDDLGLEAVISADGETLSLPAGRQLFDLCYLIDYKNESHKTFSQTEDVYELVARLLLHENATQFSVNAHSVERNLNTLRGVARCPETGLPRNFSTFANTRLGFPIEAVTRFCAWSTLRELVENDLLKTTLSPAKRAEEAQTFLTTHELDEQGPTDQVLNRLLQHPQKRTPMSEGTEGVGRTFGKDKSPREFVTLIGQKLDTFKKSLPVAESIVTDNLAFYLGKPTGTEYPVRNWLDSYLNDCIAKLGTRGAAAVLEELVVRTTALRGEMISENRLWADTESKARTGAMDRALSALSGMSRVKAMVSSKDDTLKGEAIGAFQAIVRDELRTVARNAAIKVFDGLISLASSRKQTVDTFVSTCETLSRTVNSSLNTLRVERRRETANFVVEMDVTDRGFLEEYYQANRVAPSRLLKAAKDAAGSDAPYYMRLLPMKTEGLVKEFGQRAADLYFPKIKSLSVVEHISSRADERGSLAVKLGELFDMCQPFWNTRLPQVNMQYDQFIALGCVPQASDTGGAGGFPQEVRQWAQRYTKAIRGGVAAPANLVATTAPYEIELVRYTHGARAWYLSDAADWKEKFEQTVKQKAFPLLLSKGLSDIPDLFPDKKKISRQSFALAMAFGFVAKRGDYYYMNLDGGQAEVDGAYQVPMDTEWQTVFGPPTDRKISDDTGPITFLFKKRKPKESLLLAQGRTQACSKLGQDPKKVEAILTALSEYVKAVGSAAVKAQLSAYEAFLDDFEADKLRDQIELERDSIKDYRKNLE